MQRHFIFSIYRKASTSDYHDEVVYYLYKTVLIYLIKYVLW